MIRSKTSEFIYQPILDNVEGLALRKENWTWLFSMPFFKKNYSKPWCREYVKAIKKPVEEHRAATAEKFQNRVDYVEMSAFGVGFKQKATGIEGFDQVTVEKLLGQATGFGRLSALLYGMNRELELLMYKLVGLSTKYDLSLETIYGLELRAIQE